MKAKFIMSEHVAVNFGYPGAFGSSKIIGIVQTKSAIKYNVQVVLSPPHVKPREVTRLYNIEERFIMSRQDWLNANQARPSFGTEYFNEEILLTPSRADSANI
jgi:hypothetical protein